MCGHVACKLVFHCGFFLWCGVSVHKKWIGVFSLFLMLFMFSGGFSVHEPRASSFLVSLFSATYFLGSHDYLDIGLIAFFFFFLFPDTGFELSQNLFLVSVD